MKWLLLFTMLASPLAAQRIDTGEIGGGAAYNIALRLPFMLLPAKHRGVLPRAVLFTVGSLFYEVFIDPHHTKVDSIGKWTSTGQMRADVKGREVGYLAMELVVLGGRAVWKAVH